MCVLAGRQCPLNRVTPPRSERERERERDLHWTEVLLAGCRQRERHVGHGLTSTCALRVIGPHAQLLSSCVISSNQHPPPPQLHLLISCLQLLVLLALALALGGLGGLAG
jgi:hypothetical protein